MNGNNATYFDSFRVVHIPKEITKLIRKKISEQIFLEFKHMIQ